MTSINFSEAALVELVKVIADEMPQLIDNVKPDMKRDALIANNKIASKLLELETALNRYGWEKKVDAPVNRMLSACACRKAKGYSKGWCGIAGGGVPACDH
jgi:hypothetical protein